MHSVDLRGVKIPPAIIEQVPESIARENVIIPLMEENGFLQIAIGDPSDYETLIKLQFILNKTIQPVLAPTDQIIKAISRHYFALE